MMWEGAAWCCLIMKGKIMTTQKETIAQLQAQIEALTQGMQTMMAAQAGQVKPAPAAAKPQGPSLPVVNVAGEVVQGGALVLTVPGNDAATTANGKPARVDYGNKTIWQAPDGSWYYFNFSIRRVADSQLHKAFAESKAIAKIG